MVSVPVRFLLALAAITAFAVWGTYAEDQNEKQRDQLNMQYKVAPEFIKTRDFQVPTEYQSVTSGKFATAYTYWVTAETEGWILLNGPRGTDLCPKVLGTFGYVNAHDEVMSAAGLSMLAAGFRNKPLELQVYVPRFKTAPAGLGECPGFSYDAATGMLMVGSKRIAYLAEAQPRLAQAAINK